MPESAMFRGEGGGLHKFDLPLPAVYAAQERAGRLVRVDSPPPSAPVAPPAPVVEQVQPAEPDADAASLGSLERPARSDSKGDWVAYASLVSDRPASELDDMTKSALIAEFGG